MKNKRRLAIFVHHPECSIQSAHGIVKSLYDDFEIDCISKDKLKTKFLKKYDLLAVPGGIGDSNTWHKIMEPTQDDVLNYIAKGKRYLGICMGAYWAGKHYFNMLDGVEPVQYIKRRNADIRRSFGTVSEITWLDKEETMYFYDGCAFLDKGGKYDVIARYSNNDPAAIIQGNIGLIGPHPESDTYWYDKLNMKPYWHEGKHHQLLSDFVQRLF